MVRRPQTTSLLLALAMASIPLPGGWAQEGPPGLRITEILADPATGHPEFVEVANDGPHAVDLAGWKVRDELTTPATFTFPAWQLPAGGRVVVWSGTNATDGVRGPRWTTTGKWNNGGDSVQLLAPEGTVVDYFAYGSGTAAPPPGFEARAPLPVAPRGSSLAWTGSAWEAAEPTPGQAPGGAGGVEVVVENVPPTVSLHAVPERVRPGAALVVHVEVHDDNGDADVQDWVLRDAEGELGHGTEAGAHEVALEAPGPGTWSLELSAQDQAGQSATASLAVEVRDGGLEVQLPPAGRLRFPPLRPGDEAVESLEPFVVRNDGPSTVRPLFDMSDLAGRAGAFAAEGNLDLGTSQPGGGAAWIPYDHALTPLPEIPPGGALEVRLRLRGVPSPLAAGAYGSSFTVVGA